MPPVSMIFGPPAGKSPLMMCVASADATLDVALINAAGAIAPASSATAASTPPLRWRLVRPGRCVTVIPPLVGLRSDAPSIAEPGDPRSGPAIGDGNQRSPLASDRSRSRARSWPVARERFVVGRPLADPENVSLASCIRRRAERRGGDSGNPDVTLLAARRAARDTGRSRCKTQPAHDASAKSVRIH